MRTLTKVCPFISAVMLLHLRNFAKILKPDHGLCQKKILQFHCRRKNYNAASLATAYKPKHVEANNWQSVSEGKSPYDSKRSRGPFRMILPPPNVTGSLHLGHALMAIVQDVICRQRRQLGYEVDWVPGTDHAGIATQVVVEKKLLKERGVSRHQLGREQFLQEVHKWKEDKVSSILQDLQKLGCTLNWKQQYFTMDEQQTQAVSAAFEQLFDEGLIQRRESLVNWSCSLESTISDIEVETLELSGATDIAVPGHDKPVTFGRIYDISYAICDSHEHIVVSTTRPETILGDVAVAVHPEDPRYLRYRRIREVKLWHPFRYETIPLIFDLEVDPACGTGAVKITPAHDKLDFEIATRHKLLPISVFTDQGRIAAQFEDFQGLLRFVARERILAELQQQELLLGVREHAMTLPICSRSKDVVEYMLRPQWFLHCQPMADAAMSEVQSGRMQIVPSNYEVEWFRWLENCRDWCISRQLWWGHQVPAYWAEDAKGNATWVAATSEQRAQEKACQKLKAEDVTLKRDTDVLDTWFSSALLPFSVFGWPDLKYRGQYPLDLMETGHDILFFWVARMTMLGLHFTGDAPFKKVLLNGIVCDAHGRKMSKSLGNVVTPQQVVQGADLQSLREGIQKSYASGLLSEQELQKSLRGLERLFPNGIPACGTDALRFTLCSHNIKSHFINFDVAECHANKLFFNKIWQATRYTLAAAERLKFPWVELESMNHVELSKWDRWILCRLADTLKTCAHSFENYSLHLATAALKNFFYSNLCDVYLETCKRHINAASSQGYVHCATLGACLSWGLQALLPFTPFLAQELLQHFPHNIELNLGSFSDASLEQEIAAVLEICQAIRQLKSRNQISKKHDPRAHLFAVDDAAFDLLKNHLNEMQALTLTNGVQLHEAGFPMEKLKLRFNATAGHLCSFGISTNNLLESAHETEITAQALNDKKLQKLQTELERFRTRVDNEGFRRSASEQVQRKHLEKIRQLETEIDNIKSIINV